MAYVQVEADDVRSFLPCCNSVSHPVASRRRSRGSSVQKCASLCILLTHVLTYNGAAFLPSNDQPNTTGVGNTDRGSSLLHPTFSLPHSHIGYLRDQPTQSKGGGGFWTVEYYQQYFDVDTRTVLKRCYTTLIPTEARTYISTHLNPPDMYGPFWTLTTLIFALFLSSSLAASISAYLSTDGSEYDYDFRLLSIAVTVVYAYGLALPVLLWLALRYLGVGEWSIIEAMAIWGYAQFVWIPVSVRPDRPCCHLI